MYGFDVSGNPINLFIRVGESPSHENGIGVVNDPNNEINTQEFAQIDFGDFIRMKKLKCNDPKIKIGSIQVGEGVLIYGSNQLGVKGILLYSYINTIDNSDVNASQEFVIPSFNTTDLTTTGDIYKYGPIPFRYITVIASRANITLNTLTLYLCEC